MFTNGRPKTYISNANAKRKQTENNVNGYVSTMTVKTYTIAVYLISV